MTGFFRYFKTFPGDLFFQLKNFFLLPKDMLLNAQIFLLIHFYFLIHLDLDLLPLYDSVLEFHQRIKTR